MSYTPEQKAALLSNYINEINKIKEHIEQKKKEIVAIKADCCYYLEITSKELAGAIKKYEKENDIDETLSLLKKLNLDH